MMDRLGLALYHLILALWVGGIAVFTFMVTPLVFRSFGRDEAGVIVGKLFPAYFTALLVLSVAALLVFFFLIGTEDVALHRASLILLSLAIVINMVITFTLHPEIRKVKQEIHSFAEVNADHPLRKRFARLHGISALLNLVLLGDGAALIVLSVLSRR